MTETIMGMPVVEGETLWPDDFILVLGHFNDYEHWKKRVEINPPRVVEQPEELMQRREEE